MDVFANIQRILDWVQRFTHKVDFFLVTGDLVRDREADGYLRLKQLLAYFERFEAPVLLGPGNHDQREYFHRIIGGASDQSDRPQYYAESIRGLRIIVLDSSVPGEHYGLIDDEQLRCLTTQLGVRAPAGTLIAVHHPLFPGVVDCLLHQRLMNPDALIDVLVRGDILGVVAGHVHYSSTAIVGGVLCATAPAASYLIDPSSPERFRRQPGAYGFTLGVIRDRKLQLQPCVLHTDS